MFSKVSFKSLLYFGWNIKQLDLVQSKRIFLLDSFRDVLGFFCSVLLDQSWQLWGRFAITDPHWEYFTQWFALPYHSGSESLIGIQRSPEYPKWIIYMFRPLFFSQNTIMFEKVLLFPKIPQKLSVFQDVYDYHLILGEKQRLKQEENCSLTPWPSFDTCQTCKCAMIRVVLWVLSLFCSLNKFFGWILHK